MSTSSRVMFVIPVWLLVVPATTGVLVLYSEVDQLDLVVLSLLDSVSTVTG